LSDFEWNIPGAAILQSVEGASIGVCRKLGLSEANSRFLGAYDQLEESTGSITRYSIFLAEIALPAPIVLGGEHMWISLDHCDQHYDLSKAMQRCVTLLKRLQ
jgi:hypothetical protein